jgi:hypothetical protein
MLIYFNKKIFKKNQAELSQSIKKRKIKLLK